MAHRSSFDYGEVPLLISPTKHALRLLTLLPASEPQEQITCILTSHAWEPTLEETLPSQEFIDYVKSWAVDEGVEQVFSPTLYGSGPSIELEFSAVKYEALSYTWGNPTPCQIISLNGHSFAVGQSLFDALYHLRMPVASRTLWVDAICINQEDNVDKGYQVSKMHRIYGEAADVIIWLGPQTENSQMALKFAEQIFLVVRPEGDPNVSADEIESDDKLREVTAHLLVKDYIEAWISLHQLLTRPWFTRAWTLQEFTMARHATFTCGGLSIAWPVMEVTIAVVFHHWRAIRDLISLSKAELSTEQSCHWDTKDRARTLSLRRSKAARKLYNERRVMSSSATLEIFFPSHHRICQFAGDQVYSVLGLVPPAVHCAFTMSTPAYTSSVADVYKHFARAFVFGVRSLDLLCHSQYQETRHDLPSWVPDWRLPMITVPIRLIDVKGEVLAWHDKAIVNHMPTVSKDCAILSVFAIHLGEITKIDLQEHLTPSLYRGTYPVQGLEGSSAVVKHWELSLEAKQAFRFAVETHEKESMLWENEANVLLGLFLLLLKSEYPKRGNLIPNERLHDMEVVENPTMQQIYRDLESFTGCRTVVETDVLDMALAPSLTQPGDIVVQMIGCSVPSVLRKMPGGRYQYLGESLIYGLPGMLMIKHLEEQMKIPGRLKAYDLI